MYPGGFYILISGRSLVRGEAMVSNNCLLFENLEVKQRKLFCNTVVTSLNYHESISLFVHYYSGLKMNIEILRTRETQKERASERKRKRVTKLP